MGDLPWVYDVENRGPRLWSLVREKDRLPTSLFDTQNFALTMYKYALRRHFAATRPFHAIGRRWAHAPSMFNWEDPLDSNSLFTEEELAIQETAKSYCQEHMLPRVLGRCSSLAQVDCSIEDFGNRCLPK